MPPGITEQMPSPRPNNGRTDSDARSSAEMTVDGSSREPLEGQPAKGGRAGIVSARTSSVLTPISFEHFNLGERVDKNDHLAMPKGSGLATVSPGLIRCTVGLRTDWVNLTVEVHDDVPPDVTGDYEDVVERSFHCASGELSVLDWKRELVHVLPSLAEGTFRLRYHSRHMDDGTGLSIGSLRNVGESLIQIWPAPKAAVAELKITSANGRFWHPAFTTFDLNSD
jgi:hypothetical protein